MKTLIEKKEKNLLSELSNISNSIIKKTQINFGKRDKYAILIIKC
tara:strand:- start:1828 stop:1962 length:135 start_codon:yes stop_codon:yes gene_type:complete